MWISSWLLLIYKPAGWSVTGNGIHSLDNSLFFGFEPVPPCWITANRSEPSPYTVLHARVFNQKVSVICGLLPGHVLVHRIREEWNTYEWGMGEERLTGRGVVFQGSLSLLIYLEIFITLAITSQTFRRLDVKRKGSSTCDLISIPWDLPFGHLQWDSVTILNIIVFPKHSEKMFYDH